MKKIDFKNLPDKTTPLSAENLKLMQDYAEEDIEGSVLYENEVGTTENITLNESSENFKYLEIFFFDSHNLCNSVKVYKPNEKKINLHTFNVYSGSGTAFAYSRVVTIFGTSINNVSGDDNGHWASWNNSINATNDIKIYRVMGHEKIID